MSGIAKERRNSPSPEAMTAQPSQLASVDSADTASPLQITTNSNALMQRRDTSSQESATMVQQFARSGGAGMSFLELPAEIRNMIYSYVFPEGAALLLARHNGRGYIAMSDRLELLYTCRQIFEEATSLLKASRRFTIVQPKTLEHLMDQNCKMPCYCLERQGIFEQILAGDTLFYEYDMDRDTVRKHIPALLYASTTLQDFILTFIRWIKVTAIASTATTRSSFTSFNALRDWLTRVPNCLFTHEFDDPFEIAIILRFRSEVKYTPLKDIRFEINGLPDAMWSESCNGHLLYATSEVLIEQTRGVTSNTQLLVDVLAELVFFMQSAVRQHPELKGKRCPRIWMDGLYRVREAHFRLADGTNLALTNDNEFWWPRASEFSGFDRFDSDGRWRDMVSMGLTDGLDPAQLQLSESEQEIAGKATLEEATTILIKRLAHHFQLLL